LKELEPATKQNRTAQTSNKTDKAS